MPLSSARESARDVGAPTSLALSLAEDSGMILVGFNRSQRCVVYAGSDRVGV